MHFHYRQARMGDSRLVLAQRSSPCVDVLMEHCRRDSEALSLVAFLRLPRPTWWTATANAILTDCCAEPTIPVIEPMPH